MSYYFFVNDILLPVTPESVTVKFSNKNEVIDLINGAEGTVIKTPGLTEIAFEARLPNRYYNFAQYEGSAGQNLLSLVSSSNSASFKKASYYLEQFAKIKENKKPVRLIIIRTAPDGSKLHDTNMLVTLEDYSTEESFSDGIDVTCPLTFRQYKKFATKECEVTTNADGTRTMKVKETRDTEDKETPRAYKVAEEMSVLEATKKALNNPNSWRSVAKLNGFNLPTQTLPVGTVLRFE